MSRPLRIEFPGAWYHVINRGRRSEAIYSVKKDYSEFLDLLIEMSEIWNANIAVYCLMLVSRRGVFNKPRNVAIYLLRNIRGDNPNDKKYFPN